MPQSLSLLWTHVIFSTKKRHPFLTDPLIRQRMHAYLASICQAQQCQAVIIGGTADHVHLLLNLHKNRALSTFIEQLKKSSSKWIKTIASPNDHLQLFYWQKGYGAFSVSQSNVQIVKHYIANQEKHHLKQSFQEELRALLNQHAMTYHEAYLWD